MRDARRHEAMIHMPMRRFVAPSLLVIVSVLFSVGVAEALARRLYTEPWYEKLVNDAAGDLKRSKKPSHLRDNDFIFDLRTDQFDLLSDKAPGDRRILILGDSFTYGQGVADDSAVFPSLLESRLNQDLRLPGVKHIHVLNGGLPGSLTRDWVDLWNDVSNFYRPDVLLVVFFLRDGTRTGSIPDFFGKIRDDIVVRNRRSFLYRHSYLFRTIQDGLDRKTVGEKYTQVFIQSYFGNEGQTAEWQEAQANLLRLQEMARRRSIGFGFVIFPVLVELNDSYPFHPIVDLLEEFAVKNGIYSHNLLPDFLGQDGPNLWVSAYDQHPNERAHRIAAESMLPFVRDLLKSHEAGASNSP